MTLSKDLLYVTSHYFPPTSSESLLGAPLSLSNPEMLMFPKLLSGDPLLPSLGNIIFSWFQLPPQAHDIQVNGSGQSLSATCSTYCLLRDPRFPHAKTL